MTVAELRKLDDTEKNNCIPIENAQRWKIVVSLY